MRPSPEISARSLPTGTSRAEADGYGGVAAYALLVIAAILSVALGLYLTRGATFGVDEFWYFLADRGLSPRALLTPHNGNLIVVIRTIYAAVFELFGPNYVVFRCLEAVGIAINGVLVFILVRARVGPVVALAPTLVLLFLGTSPDVTLSPNGITHVYCVMPGLAALIALDRGSRGGDLLACALLTISVGAFSFGLAVLAGSAVSILLRDDRWRRIWIAVVPLTLYVAWLVASPHFKGPTQLSGAHVRLGNAPQVPGFAVHAAAAVVSAVTGLSHYLPTSHPVGRISYSWGFLILVLAAVAVAHRVYQGRASTWFWSFLVIPLAFWTSIQMVIGPNRFPNSTRYIYAGAIGVVLVASEAARRQRWHRRGWVALTAAAALALSANIAELDRASRSLRSSAPFLRAVLTSIDTARDQVRPNFVPPVVGVLIAVGGGTGQYLRAVARHGSFAFSVRQLRSQPEAVRGVADAILVEALRIVVVPAGRPASTRHCTSQSIAGSSSEFVTARPPGILIRSATGGTVKLARFSSLPRVSVGVLAPGRFGAMALPVDRAPDAWRVGLPRGRVTVCRLS